MSKSETNSNIEIRNRDGRQLWNPLEERPFQFAGRVRAFVRRLPRTVCNYEDVKQVIRASGSIGANYIEANEALGKRDFMMHIRNVAPGYDCWTLGRRWNLPNNKVHWSRKPPS